MEEYNLNFSEKEIEYFQKMFGIMDEGSIVSDDDYEKLFSLQNMDEAGLDE